MKRIFLFTWQIIKKVMKISWKTIKILFKVLLIYFLLCECLKLYFLSTADRENRLIQEVEIETSDKLHYFNLREGLYETVCNENLCETRPYLKIIEISNGIILRIAIDEWYSYFEKYLFDAKRPELYSFPLEGESRFKNRTYQEQLISWHSIVIPFEDDRFRLIYFLDSSKPYIGIIENEYLEDRLVLEKFRTNNLAESFLKIDQNKLEKALQEYNINDQVDAEMMNQKIEESYNEYIQYEKELQFYSIIISIIKIIILIILIFYRRCKKEFKKILTKLGLGFD
ncbi:hypothetical protein [Anaerorhabdus furcosa]|uniref:Uncharacterized protein n=1 Tax=Anaerorhabdus furcosa TaxID=118967 RepID=A0A1T4PDV1_9FIRM|nr:hypothetical protein [Anaerorhabdus furcosa]SJZ89682.1 hypothetical protein SAMN02745191_1968 [Anaerorhabdus furcosa]